MTPLEKRLLLFESSLHFCLLNTLLFGQGSKPFLAVVASQEIFIKDLAENEPNDSE